MQACELESQVVMRNEVVALEGDVATHLYIVVSGELVRRGHLTMTSLRLCLSFYLNLSSVESEACIPVYLFVMALCSSFHFTTLQPPSVRGLLVPPP